MDLGRVSKIARNAGLGFFGVKSNFAIALARAKTGNAGGQGPRAPPPNIAENLKKKGRFVGFGDERPGAWILNTSATDFLKNE